MPCAPLASEGAIFLCLQKRHFCGHIHVCAFSWKTTKLIWPASFGFHFSNAPSAFSHCLQLLGYSGVVILREEGLWGNGEHEENAANAASVPPEARAEAPKRNTENAANARHLYNAQNDGSRGRGNMQSASLLENG